MFTALKNLVTGGGQKPSFAVGRVPEGVRVYAVGDIHGCKAQLEGVLAKMRADVAGFVGRVVWVFIGDYIDRGPDSAGVVETLKELRLPDGHEAVFLRGNHEQGMLEFLDDPAGRPDWLGWGGVEALASYGISLYDGPRARTPESLAAELRHVLEERGHMEFIHKTVLTHVEGGVAFVHAGVRPQVALHRQVESDLLFIREDFINRPHGLPYRVIFGHTIQDKPLILDDRIGIDTGAFQGGPLTAVCLEDEDVRVIQEMAT